MKNGWIKNIIEKKETKHNPLSAIGYCVTDVHTGNDYTIESIIQKTPAHFRCKQPNLYLRDDEYKLFDSYESALAWAEDLCYLKYYENLEPANLYFDGKRIEVTKRYISNIVQRKDTSNDAPVVGHGGGWGAKGGFDEAELPVQAATDESISQTHSGFGV